MKVSKTKIKDLKVFTSKVHRDSRGYFKETFKKNTLKKIKFVFNCVSSSKKRVLRGLHLQTKYSQGKYLTVLKGEIYDVVIDLRKNSRTFGKYVSVIISDKSDFSFYIPEGFAHGFMCLSEKCTVNYKCSNYRVKKFERTLNWKDKSVNIKWPIRRPILSKKDTNGLSLKDFKNKF